jgi:cytochrome c-type biogenesis protein CcmE
MTKNKQRLALVIALGVAALVVVLISTSGIEKNLVYYLDADELLSRGARAQGATVRLGGLVQEHSLKWEPEQLRLTFSVSNHLTGSPNIFVTAHGAPPQMFQEGIGAVVEGRWDGHGFDAERVLVKHSNEYRPPAEGERPKDLYGTLEAPLTRQSAPAASAPSPLSPPPATTYE